MKRFVLAIIACLMLAATVVGCEEYDSQVTPTASTVEVGEPLGMSVLRTPNPGCVALDPDSAQKDNRSYTPLMKDFQWRVEPAEGAKVVGGEFVATKPGTYTVYAWDEKAGINPSPAKVTVVEAGDKSFGDDEPEAEPEEEPADAAQGEPGDSGGSDVQVDPADAVQVFATESDLAVNKGNPPNPTVVELAKPTVITQVMTYHWNDAQGTSGGGTIAMQSSSGQKYGPWKVVETGEGQGGVPNAYWYVRPMVELPAGSYTVIDSDPGTWSWNDETKGMGCVIMQGVPIE